MLQTSKGQEEAAHLGASLEHAAKVSWQHSTRQGGGGSSGARRGGHPRPPWWRLQGKGEVTTLFVTIYLKFHQSAIRTSTRCTGPYKPCSLIHVNQAKFYFKRTCDAGSKNSGPWRDSAQSVDAAVQDWGTLWYKQHACGETLKIYI